MDINESSNVMHDSDMYECDDQLKPLIGRTFESLNQFEEFYKSYAHTIGFSVRSWTATKDESGEIKYKSFVCSKQGYKGVKKNVLGKDKEEKVQKRRLNTREGCCAKVCVKKTDNGKYSVITFNESHSHELCTPRKRHFLRSNRKVTNTQKNLLSTLDRVNIGPSKAFQMIKEQVGGFENVGFTKMDAQNYVRDLKAMIKDSDAHMFIHSFKLQKERDPSFYYAYELDSNDQLKNVFWADGLARYNFTLFGDLLSFDTTYRTNKYSMIFAPFTGINNHRFSITFGAALLVDERIETFSWLFEKFLECMGGNQPTLIVTDQDPAIRNAIQISFKASRHRFCIWHILKKLSEKVGGVLNCDSTFQSRFNKCVWTSETSTDFEHEWNSIMFEYNLFSNDWLAHMYELRHMWIPAYFIDISLSGLLRTTSRSESENSFFNNFVNHKLGLVEFYSRFESAMDAQRQRELKANHDSVNGKPNLKTNLPLELHAREIYTHRNFYIFQDELWASSMGCGVKSLKEINDDTNAVQFTIYDSCKPDEKCREVFYSSSTTKCSCKMFECQGIPCRHIICVWKGQAINEIPSYCMKSRWTKLGTSRPIFHLDKDTSSEINASLRGKKLISTAWSQFSHCLDVAKGNDEALMSLINVCSLWEQNWLDSTDKIDAPSTIYSFYESQKPKEIEIYPPNVSKTKGSGKRLKGGKEISLETRKKQQRLCKACGEHGLHDSRNCPKKTLPKM